MSTAENPHEMDAAERNALSDREYAFPKERKEPLQRDEGSAAARPQ